MSSTKWTPIALKARLRADIALGTVARPMTAADAARRLEFHRIVAAVDAGRIGPEAGAEMLDGMLDDLSRAAA